MRTQLLLPALALGISAALAQPAIQWENTYGGPDDEAAHAALRTTDGGYLLVGHTTSEGGQVTGQHGNEDLWAVKTDANGALLWQRALGSEASEGGLAVTLTSDGGYLIAGTADDPGGDVGNVIGDGDVWLVKLDASGTIVWENTYGGTSYDEPRAMVETAGGYVVAAYTESDNGQVTGYSGSGDLWMFGVSGTGTLLWQLALGGTDTDEPFGMAATMDGGVIVAGASKSNNGTLTQNFGGEDAWLVKLSAAGALQWQQVYGHTGDERAMDVVQRADGGFAFAAATNSQGGPVSQHFGNYDYWLVRVNPNGTLQGQSSFGGSGDDIPRALVHTSDGGYALAGYTASDNQHVTAPLGGFDQWVVKTDAGGVMQWQRTLGGSDDDEAFALEQTPDGGYIVAGLTNSDDQHVQLGRGGIDFWAVKLGPDVVSVAELDGGPMAMAVHPQPARDHARLHFTLDTPAPVRYLLIDAAGRTVLDRSAGTLPAGTHQLPLDLSALESGRYQLWLHAGDHRAGQAVVVVR
ncbi:MAG: hypothetical protein RBT71_03565 [Flavobacteriales bacterium]|jgi:hypothetical protein|nr:hypothetical protein [Flavobacteriales bacterium]